MEDQKLDEERKIAGKTLHEMLAEAHGYVELFLEDLENKDSVIEEPQLMLLHILATLNCSAVWLGLMGICLSGRSWCLSLLEVGCFSKDTPDLSLWGGEYYRKEFTLTAVEVIGYCHLAFS
jgi:hypothetical protein